MIKYSIRKNGLITNSWTSEFADHTHYEPCFGLPERPELDVEGNPTGVMLPAEYTIEIEDITAQVAQEAVNAEALAYLASTDWLIIREVDAGVACPAEIKAERAAARARIVR